ncbi:hypothetical protein KCU62_g1698, partial [Aureobasidium sp. EXF-3399]
MHTSYLSAAVASLMLLTATAAPAPVSPSQSTTIQASRHQLLPGSLHAPNLHPSASPSENPSPTPQNLKIGRRASNLNADEMKDLIMEIKREDRSSSLQNQKTANTDGSGHGGGKADDGEDHATYMLGSPVSFPARGGGQGEAETPLE